MRKARIDIPRDTIAAFGRRNQIRRLSSASAVVLSTDTMRSTLILSGILSRVISLTSSLSFVGSLTKSAEHSIPSRLKRLG